MKTTKIDPKDRKFFTPDGDPGFNYERNQAIIDASIKSYAAMRKKKIKEFHEGLGERNDAIITWVKSMQGSNKPLEQYLGKQMMTKLVGEKILTKIKKLQEIRERTNQWIV
jgi:hypothetical protein